MLYASLILLFVVSAESVGPLCKLAAYSPTAVKYYSYFPFDGDRLEFLIRGKEYAHILLSNSESWEEPSTYEIVLAYQNNTKSILRKDRVDMVVNAAPGHDVLNKDLFRRVIIDIDRVKGSLTVTVNNNVVLLHLQDPWFVTTSLCGLAAYNDNRIDFIYECSQFSPPQVVYTSSFFENSKNLFLGGSQVATA